MRNMRKEQAYALTGRNRLELVDHSHVGRLDQLVQRTLPRAEAAGSREHTTKTCSLRSGED